MLDVTYMEIPLCGGVPLVDVKGKYVEHSLLPPKFVLRPNMEYFCERFPYLWHKCSVKDFERNLWRWQTITSTLLMERGRNPEQSYMEYIGMDEFTEFERISKDNDKSVHPLFPLIDKKGKNIGRDISKNFVFETSVNMDKYFFDSIFRYENEKETNVNMEYERTVTTLSKKTGIPIDNLVGSEAERILKYILSSYIDSFYKIITGDFHASVPHDRYYPIQHGINISTLLDNCREKSVPYILYADSKKTITIEDFLNEVRLLRYEDFAKPDMPPDLGWAMRPSMFEYVRGIFTFLVTNVVCFSAENSWAEVTDEHFTYLSKTYDETSIHGITANFQHIIEHSIHKREKKVSRHKSICNIDNRTTVSDLFLPKDFILKTGKARKSGNIYVTNLYQGYLLLSILEKMEGRKRVEELICSIKYPFSYTRYFPCKFTVREKSFSNEEKEIEIRKTMNGLLACISSFCNKKFTDEFYGIPTFFVPFKFIRGYDICLIPTDHPRNSKKNDNTWKTLRSSSISPTGKITNYMKYDDNRGVVFLKSEGLMKERITETIMWFDMMGGKFSHIMIYEPR